MKKVFVLGAMGVYLVPELVKNSWMVDAVSLDERENTENGKAI